MGQQRGRRRSGPDRPGAVWRAPPICTAVIARAWPGCGNSAGSASGSSAPAASASPASASTGATPSGTAAVTASASAAAAAFMPIVEPFDPVTRPAPAGPRRAAAASRPPRHRAVLRGQDRGPRTRRSTRCSWRSFAERVNGPAGRHQRRRRRLAGGPPAGVREGVPLRRHHRRDQRGGVPAGREHRPARRALNGHHAPGGGAQVHRQHRSRAPCPGTPHRRAPVSPWSTRRATRPAAPSSPGWSSAARTGSW